MVANSLSPARPGNPLEATFFLQAEIDLAFAFLHLAHFAIIVGREGHAGELICRAASQYKTVMNYIVGIPPELEDASGLHANARKL